jgi:site-specific DNA-methyltransferase (cytosine-N4-specific)
MLIAYTAKKPANTEVRQEDARHLSIPDNQVDLIITSPPYGEERNTIPYLRWSRLFLLWLGFSQAELREIETTTLGGNDTQPILQSSIPSNTFWEAVDGVTAVRLREALPFMVDYLSCLNEMHRVLQPHGKACVVIGLRSISRQLIDMGKVTQELGDTIGLKHLTTYKRNIPKKMIPWTGPTGETIGRESIVIFEKQR